MIVVCIESLPYCTEVHWVFDDVEVIRDPMLDRIYRLMKYPSLVELPNSRDQSLSCFVPRLIDRSILWESGKLKLI